MPVLLRMPEVITGMSEAVLSAWLVDVGDAVDEGAPLAEVETEKAVVEYLAEAGGILVEQLVPTGEPIAVGQPIAVLAQDGESTDAATGAAEDAESTSPAPSPTATADAPPAADSERRDQDGAQRRFATPLVRRLARERGIDLSTVHGSGPHGRIVRRDVDELVGPAGHNGHRDTEPPPVSAPPPAADSPDHTDVDLTPMRRAIARRLAHSKATVPHFYLEADCRVDAMLELRRSVNAHRDTPLSVNDFVIKAVGAAFRAVPEANAVWNDTSVRRFTQVDVGVAVAIEGGLVTPVVRDVARKSVGAVAAEARQLTERARAGRLGQQELDGGSFCVSNLGMYGIERFAAIINPPQSGILAVGAARQRPVVTDGRLDVATLMSVTFSGDHRVFDGALAAQWLTAFVSAVEQPLTLLV
jgi:pyruvate dehydrogenase E2 component (dihydrolipoamide acetyltransferase)